MEMIKKTLQTLGFVLQDGDDKIWQKIYPSASNYRISVTLTDNANTSVIDFGNEVKFDRSTSTNLSKPENLVVLECVNRLIEKGYKPSSITLEKKWALGHREKGFLDILVTDLSGNSFLMIECKTWGAEHRKQKRKMQLDGGQLFSYFVQEKTTKYLSLYSSTLSSGRIEYENDIIIVNDDIKNATNQRDAFEAWNPQVFETRGIFEAESRPYDLVFQGITKNSLKPLREDDDIFNSFAEILRRNVISDKTNAFNKIFNLFLCKIVDEFETNDNELMRFQWQESESDETVMLRLNDLYKSGMEKYLDLKISAVTLDELDRQLEEVDSQSGKDVIKNLFIQQKLYTGNEFAFTEVFDKDTFNDNARIVKEVVKLLEQYQIKYSKKQQFLGDFFEKLLNTGIKQEAGQFFTPIPIARFICKSIPVEALIDAKNRRKEERFLPYSIDYASGSGHFLTEIMAEINKYVEKIDPEWIAGGERAKSKFLSEKDSYQWSQEYIYGIEKDYRLAKTTKISTFLNGDGDANVICADGLDSFTRSRDYKKLLTVSANGRDNEQFDILVANPPYSVSGFKNTVKDGKDSFSLYDSLTEQSSEIEALFIERTHQLLRSGGYAGIILPSSVLSNPKIHQKAREVLIKNFEFKSVVELGQNTFMATNTKTVILFLKKRDKYSLNYLENLIDAFFKSFRDFNYNEKESIVSNYLSKTYPTTSLESYIAFFNGDLTALDSNETFVEYLEDNKVPEDVSIKRIVKIEKEKILYYMLTAGQDVVWVKSGDKNVEKDFLGYEFSNRRGHEGIRIYEESKLFDEDDILNTEKVNSYILKNFLSEDLPEIPDSLKDHIEIVSLPDLIDFDSTIFEKKISINNYKKKLLTQYKLPSDKLGTFLDSLESGSRPEGGVGRIREGVVSLGGEHIGMNGLLNLRNLKYIPQSFFDTAKQGRIVGGDILICKDGAQTGKVALVPTDAPYKEMLSNEHLFVLRANEKMMQKYLYYFLRSDLGQSLLKISTTGAAQGGLNRTSLKNIKIPIVPDDLQRETIKKIDPLEEHLETVSLNLSKLEEEIRQLIQSNMTNDQKKLSNYLTLEYGAALTERDRKKGPYPVVGSNGIVGYHNEALIAGPGIIVGRKGSVGKVNWIEEASYPIDTAFWVKVNNQTMDLKYGYYLLKSLELDQLNDGMGPGGLNRNVAHSVKTSPPSIEVQQEIVKKILVIEEKITKLEDDIQATKKGISDLISASLV